MIRETADEVIGRPDYKIDVTGYDYVSLLERVLDVIARILRPLHEAFRWLHDISPLLAWLVFISLFLVAAALCVHIAYAFKVALQGRMRAGAAKEAREEGAKPETWEEEARQAAGRGDHTTALRCLFRASLLRLEEARKGRFRRGATNREYLRQFRGTLAFDPLRFFVECIDVKWYGGGGCSREDYENSTSAHGLIGRLAREMGSAHSA